MEAKRTPWEAGTNEDAHMVYDAELNAVGSTLRDDGDAEAEAAHARLFAAAPELLAALKSLVGRDLTFLDSKVMGGQITYASVKAARAAIAKAEGI